MGFGLRRKGSAVKTGNLSTQAVATDESERISRLLKKSKNKRGVRGRRARRRAGRLIEQQRATTTDEISRKPLDTTRLYTTGPAPLVIESPVQATDASTTNTSNSSLRKPANLRYSDDILDISEASVSNGQFEPVEKSGVSSFRPEIISVSNFIPVFYGDQSTYTEAGRLLSLQHQMLNVRKETLSKTFASMEEWNDNKTQQVIQKIKFDFEEELQRTHRTIEHFDKFINALETSKEGLDIKNVRTGLGLSFISIENFFEKSLQFSKQRQKFFSNTKMYLQLCSDLRAVLENYSFGLLDLTDSDRTEDVDPVDIDNTYTIKDGFTFSIDSIRSTVSAENASSSQIFTKTMNSLPQDSGDRIKLLITLLSKEYRVSKNLGTPTTAKILSDKFSQANTGNPFDNIIGIPGDTVFDLPVGPGSLSSLAHLAVSTNSIVLPFEKKYIDAQTQGKTFIPGSSYFFDTILATAGGQQFNTKPFVDYVDLASSITNDSISAINSLLELTSKQSETSRVSPRILASSFLSSTKNSIQGIISSKSVNKDQATSVALFRLANSDTKLKNMIFQFAIFSGIATQTKEDNKKVFGRLAKELGTTSAISYARIVARLAVDLTDTTKLGVLQSYLQTLAQDIEDRVFLLVSGREIPKRNTLTQTSQQSGTDNNYSSIDKLGYIDFNPDRRVVFLNEGDIKTILMSLMVPGTVASTTLFTEFLNMSNEISSGASVNGVEVFLVPDQSGRTRYNFLSTSMQLLLIFEVISSLANKYAFADFAKSRYQNKLVLDIDVKSNNFITSAIDTIIRTSIPKPPATPTSSPTAKGNEAFVSSWNAMIQYAKTGIMPQQHNTAPTISRTNSIPPQVPGRLTEQTAPGPEHTELATGLQTIFTKITEEDKVISNFLTLFGQLVFQMKNAKTVLLNTFNAATIQSFLTENSLGDLAIVRNPTQLRTASYLLSEFTELTTPTTTENNKSADSGYDSIIITDIPTEQQLKSMLSLLKESSYGFSSQADERLRIVTVGVPAGLSRKLSDRLDITKIQKESFLDRQSDVVKVNVYKRDARFDDIVFKPKTFLFDLSLFQTKQSVTNIEPRDGETFDLLLNRVSLTDFQNPKHKRAITTASILEDESYSFLTNAQRQQVIRNHFQSFLLEIYLSLMSNMKLREQTFLEAELLEAGSGLNQTLVSLVKSYIQDQYQENLGNASVQQILESQTIDLGVQDIVRLIAYGSKAFEPLSIRQEIVGSKLFDRVFHIPVTTEGFEVDLELTSATESGRKALLKNFIQQKITETSDKRLVFSNQSLETAQAEVVFADFFVTVETDF